MISNRNLLSHDTAERVQALINQRGEDTGAESLFFKVRPVRLTAPFSGGKATGQLLDSAGAALQGQEITLHRVSSATGGATGDTVWAVYRGQWEELSGAGAPGATGGGEIYFQKKSGGDNLPQLTGPIQTAHLAAGDFIGAADGGGSPYEVGGRIGQFYWQGGNINGATGIQNLYFTGDLFATATGHNATISGSRAIFFDAQTGSGQGDLTDIIETPHIAAGAYLGAANGGPCAHSNAGDGLVGLIYWKGGTVNDNGEIQDLHFDDPLTVEIDGHSATIGISGGVGPTGATGPTGPAGETITGPQGERGPTGADGKDGRDGIDGQQGIQGPQGIQGERGPTGADGKDGRDGIDGQQGIQGPQGIQGERGPTGATGPTGGGADMELRLYTGDAGNAPEGSLPFVISAFCSGGNLYNEIGWIYLAEKEAQQGAE